MRIKKIISLFLVICLILTFQPFGTKFAFAAANELNNALNVSGGTLSFINDSSHPWVVDSTTDAGRTSAVSNIAGINNGTTTLTLNAGTLAKNKVLYFDWNVNSENTDILYFVVNGTSNLDYIISGQTSTWTTFKYVIPADSSYTFTWKYKKNNSVNSGKDCGWIDNVKIVDFVPVDYVVVTPVSSSLNIGFTKQLSATVMPSDATYQDVTWSSDNTSIAAVDPLTGVVTGVAQGTAHIVATPSDTNGTAGEGTVNVLAPIATTGITLNYSTGTLLVGDSATLVATIFPELASNRTIDWYSSNVDVAEVVIDFDVKGIAYVKGISAGTVTITAQNGIGGCYAQCLITIIAESSLQDQTHLTYTPIIVGSTSSVSLGWQISDYILYNRGAEATAASAKGYSIYLEAGKKISFETSGTTLVNTYLDLYDSNFNRVAYDDDSGTASFGFIDTFFVPHTGTYYVLVSGNDTFIEGTYNSGTFNLHVSEIPPIPVTGVSFNQENFLVPLSQTLPLPYSILPNNADIKGVTFTSSNENSITVSASGEVTGVAPGSSVITIETIQGGYTDTCNVSVGYTPVASVSYDTDAVIVGINKTKTLQYTIEPAEAHFKNVTFVSNNLSVATVDSSTGIITAVGLGNAIITVTTADGGHTDTCSVKVVAVNVSTCASVTLTAGKVWPNDNSGYQMLIDADADAYGRLFTAKGSLNVSGDVPDSVYNQFEYKIPANANGVLTTSNIVFNNSIKILVPAGTYDYCITNPVPNKRVWIAATNVISPGRYNNFNFEAGYSYIFVVTNNGLTGSLNGDMVTLTCSYTGEGLSKYAVNYSVSGIGGTLSGKTQLLAEEGYTLTAADMPTPVPDPGYHFVGWNANPVGTTINAPISFTATFAINTYTVIFKDWNNTVLKTQENVAHGSTATAPASPNTKPGYHFTGWSPDYSAVTGNLTVIAQYDIDGYAVNLPTGDGFTAAPEGVSVSPVPRGNNFTFTVTLNQNYSNSTIVVKSNGTVLTSVYGVYTIQNVTEIKSVTVEGAILNNAVYTALDAAITLTPAYADSNYITASINTFRNAVTAGQGVARNLNVLSQPVIDAATTAITSAYYSLVLKAAVYIDLDNALTLLPAYNDVYYTSVTIDAFRNAMTAGLAVSRSLNITQQATVDSAAALINTTYTQLALRPDPTQFSILGTSSLVINRTNTTITGYSLRSNNAANIIAQFDNPAIITIIDVNGVQLGSADLVGTGSVIKLFNKDGVVVDQVTAIVYGDIDGNGIADGNDAALVSMLVAGMLTQAQVGANICSAADANRDGLVNNDDVILLAQSGLFLVNVS